MRKVAFVAAVATLGALVQLGPATAQPTPEVTAFCDAALQTDQAVGEALGAEHPSRKAEQELESALAGVESTAPPEVAANVQAVTTEIRTALQSGQEPSQEVIGQNLTPINEYRYNSCGYQQIAVTGIEYEFQGLPKTLSAGTVAIQFTDTGAELHELALFRLKGKESAKKAAGVHEEEFEKKVVGETEVAPQETSYLFANLEPGRYGAACHLRVGSTSERAAERAEEKDAKHHYQKGMIATIKVT